MNNTMACATPSTSAKRRKSEENHNNTTNEGSLPKKKRESAIRSENNLKILIQNKQVDTNKQKVSSKKFLSLRKEEQTKTLEALINAEKFDKIDKIFSKSVAGEIHELTDSDDTGSSEDCDSDNDPETLPPPVNNRLEPVTLPLPVSNRLDPVTLPLPVNNRLEPVTLPLPLAQTVPSSVIATEIHNTSLHSDKSPEKSKTPLSEAADITSQISSTNNLDTNKDPETNANGSQSSLNAGITSLENLLNNLVPANSKNIDIKHIENIYNTILGVKSELNNVYKQKSFKLKKSFEAIRLVVPELKKDLHLPPIEELKKNSEPATKEPELLLSRDEQTLERKEPNEASAKICQSTTPSTSSSNGNVDSKWTLKHQGPGSGLTELMPNTGIYVCEAELTRAKLLATEMRQFARLLLSVVFTEQAINTCSYTGNGPNGQRSKYSPLGLDEHARNTLIAFVTKHAKESNWTIVNPQVLIQCLRDRLRLQNRNYFIKSMYGCN